jgi:hypothetical protein
MYTLALDLHSIVRWVVLVLGALAAVRALAGWMGRRDWTPADDRAGLLFTIAADVQMLLGLALYFGLSPITASALQDMGAAMSVPSLRFWAVEHTTLMILAVVLAHVGRVLARKPFAPAARHRRAAICFLLSLVLMLVGVPWPGTPNGRPLFRVG